MQRKENESVSSYRVSCHLKMVDALLLGSRPAIGILEHLLQELYQLVSFNVVT
jgi:hypothetical protein